MQRPDPFAEEMETEFENDLIFNREKMIQLVVDDSQDTQEVAALTQNRRTLERLGKKYGVTFTHRTSEDRAFDQRHYAYQAAWELQKALNEGSLNPLLEKLLKERGVLEEGKINLERICRCIRELAMEVNINGEKKRVTVSCGVATFPEDAKVASDLIESADLALYQAKNLGIFEKIHILITNISLFTSNWIYK